VSPSDHLLRHAKHVRDPDNYPEPEPSANGDQTGAHSGLGTGSILWIIAGVGGAAAATSFIIGTYSDHHPGVIKQRACDTWKGAQSLCSRAIPGSKKPPNDPLSNHCNHWSLVRALRSVPNVIDPHPKVFERIHHLLHITRRSYL
jgi:hypothetical protein